MINNSSLQIIRPLCLCAALLALSGLYVGFAIAHKSGALPGDDTKKIEIRGIYGGPDLFWKKELRLDQLGVNAVFLHWSSINDEMMERAKNEGVKVFAEFPTPNGINYVETHPEAWAINEKGEKVEYASWFLGVCPTEPGFRLYRMKILRELLQKFDLAGVWMDYLHWHA